MLQCFSHIVPTRRGQGLLKTSLHTSASQGIPERQALHHLQHYVVWEVAPLCLLLLLLHLAAAWLIRAPRPVQESARGTSLPCTTRGSAALMRQLWTEGLAEMTGQEQVALGFTL